VTWIFFNLENAFTWQTSLSNVSCKEEEMKEVKEENPNGSIKTLILFER
jgi:hypothetical protein